ncbi:MAG: SDR family oxidoreductase [Dermatophilaceae bacterium]
MSTALVTGATAGIGHSFATLLAGRGHDLVLVARDRARLDDVAGQLRTEHRVEVEVLVADLADRVQVQTVADRVADRARPVDLVVNNAGFALAASFLEDEVADEERLLDVHCVAVLVLSHAAARAMVERGHGAIVNVSSTSSFVAMGTYSAAKAWTTVFSEGLARELAGTGVTVTAVCPGFTHTEFHSRAAINMSRLPEFLWLDADAVARAGLDDVAKGRTVSVPGWQYKALVGLLRVAPRGLVRRLSGEISRRRRGGRH